MKRRLALAALALLGGGAAGLLPAAPASAHPLGNFSVNQLEELTLRPDRITVAATVDLAELPTLQDKPSVDTNHDGTASDAERAAHATTTCAALATDFHVTVGGHRLAWTVTPGTFGYASGAAGLQISRLTCTLTAPAALDRRTGVDVDNRYRADRIGWRELTAVGDGVRLLDSPLPTSNVSAGLTAYPQNLLASPLDVRTAQLTTEPGAGGSTGAVAAPAGQADFLTRWYAAAESRLTGLVGDRLTPLVGLLAVLLSLVLGAAHAALPGHGKTVMAAYLAGKRGRPRDAVVVGATVTATHTGGVLVLGLLLTTTAGLAGEAALKWLGVASGLLVAVVGVGMLVGAVRARRRDRAHERAHAHGHPHSHEHGHSQGHGHLHGHGHSHGHGHAHDHGNRRVGRLGLAGMGIAGGLVPSPSALLVLLGAIGLGRTGFGVLLVLAYGLGMAATLTAAGLLLVRLRDRWLARQRRRGWSRLGRRLSAAAPSATATLVLLVGLGLAGRALGLA